jgi:hypothetical protein
MDCLKLLANDFNEEIYVKCIANAILNYNLEHFNAIISYNLLNYLTRVNLDTLRYLEVLFVVYKPKLSTILTQSSIFQNDCEIYTLSSINSWIENNPELYDTEIPFFHDLIKKFNKYVDIDVNSYDYENVFSAKFHRRVSTQTNDEKLKQLYTIIKYYSIHKNS